MRRNLPVAEPALPILQNVRKRYIRAAEYRTYQLKNCSTHFDNAVLRYITKVVEKVETHMKAHFFDPSNLISNINSLAASMISCVTNQLHKGAAVLVSMFLLRTHWNRQ